jgi:SAM-dependent methyltransferase
MSHPERIVPDDTEPGIVALHAARYEFALPFCDGRDVLDAACGVGYGTAILRRVAKTVVGVDVDEPTVSYARQRYGGDGIAFEVMDVTSLALADASFDVVCSFETIEHVDDPERAVAEAARVLRPRGTYVVSTPHVDRTTRNPENPHHRVELSRADLERILHARFDDVALYGQRRVQSRRHTAAQRLDLLGLRRIRALRRVGAAVLRTPTTETLTADDVEITADAVEDATELVAVCVRA